MTDFASSAQLFSQAAVLLMVGMAFVFAFLSVLIIAIKFVITPIGQRFPDPIPVDKANMANQQSTDSRATIAAISVAIQQYRKKHR